MENVITNTVKTAYNNAGKYKNDFLLSFKHFNFGKTYKCNEISRIIINIIFMIFQDREIIHHHQYNYNNVEIK